MMAQNEFVVVGIDVAKDKVDACIRSCLKEDVPESVEWRPAPGCSRNRVAPY